MQQNESQRIVRIGFTMVTLLFIIAFVGCNSGDNSKSSNSSNISVPTRQWFEGGTLHNATVGQWLNASYENKLATCSDWLATTSWKGHIHSLEDFNRIKVKAEMLVVAVDGVVADKQIESLNVTEFAVALITMSNDLGP